MMHSWALQSALSIGNAPFDMQFVEHTELQDR